MAHRTRPLHKQRHRRRRQQRLDRDAGGVGRPHLGRERQRRHRVLPLGAQPQHPAAGRQDRHARAAGQQLVQLTGDVDDLLQVVQDQQPAAVAELLGQGLKRRARPRQVDAHRPGDAAKGQLGPGDPGQRDEHDARSEAVTQAFGHGHRQAGLADPTRPAEGHQPGPVQQPPDLGDLLLPAHERGELPRQVVAPGVQRPRRREVGPEPLHHQVVQVLGQGDVLQPVRTQVPEGHPFRQGMRHQPPGGVGDDDLPAVAGRGDPGRPVHVQADIVVPAQHPLPGVQAHPHPHRPPRRPVVGGQAPLGGHRGPDRPDRAGERHEEGVPLGADLHAAASLDGVAHDRGMLVADRRIPIPQLLQQPSGALDVGKQEGDRPGRQPRHEGRMRPGTGPGKDPPGARSPIRRRRR